MNTNSRQRGFSALEALVSLGTASLVAAALCAMLGASGLAYREAAGPIADLSVAAAAENAIRAGSRSVGRSRLPYALTVAPSASAPLSNGAPHPLASLTGASAPAPGSQIVSFVELSPLYAGTIERTTYDGSSLQLVACGFQMRPSASQFKSYVALGVSGSVQIVGTLRAVSISCVELIGTPIAGLVSSPATVLPCSLHRQVPVNREHSHLVDRTGQLRISSPTGAQLTENQPLGSGAREIHISELPNSEAPVALSVSVNGINDHTSSFILPLPLLPTHHYDYIF